jgi:ribosomal protein S20
MNVSSVSSTDYNSSTTSLSKKSAHSNPLQQAVTSLASDLKSGDTASAASEVSDILSNTDGSSNSSDTGNPITNYLKSLKAAIASGDTTGAQSLVSTLQDYKTANPPPTPPDGGSDATRGFSTDGNPLEQAVTSLASDLKSGDTTSAASEVSDMIAHTSKHSQSSGTDSSSSADDLNTYLKSLQTALAAGDTTGAQSLVASLQNHLSADQAANGGTYSASGNYNSTTGSNSISALA